MQRWRQKSNGRGPGREWEEGPEDSMHWQLVDVLCPGRPYWKESFTYQTFRTVQRMAIGTALARILGSNKSRMDAKDFTWLFHLKSNFWVLLTTTKAHFILKTPHRRLVPEMWTLDHCGQVDHTLDLASSKSRGALTLWDVLLCGPLPTLKGL